jgi:dTDP-4-amino-4,6-dideoxygalactose transaminase
MTEVQFTKSFTQQESIPAQGIKLATAIMESGRLHRYNLEPDEDSQASLLESEFAKWQGVDYCVACTSGGYAIQLALRICGVKPGDEVLANAYTLAPVPGAIQNVGAQPVFIEIDSNYHIDLDDLNNKAKSTGAKFLLLSHMRGHIADMDRILAICETSGITLIEDCAHTMGSRWKGVRSGNFGRVAVFSTQTYKHLNSGEGGFLVTNEGELAAKAVVSSGSYMLYGRHGAIPVESIFQKVRLHAPNYSGRMDQLRASILRPQLTNLEKNIHRWNDLYGALFLRLSKMNGIVIPKRLNYEFYVGSSIQFRVPTIETKNIPKFVNSCLKRGVELKWFGDDQPKAFTSRYDSWAYIENLPILPNTLSILEKTLDMRIPLTFNVRDCETISDVLESELRKYQDK